MNLLSLIPLGLLTPWVALAHVAWFSPDSENPGQFVVLFGHGEELESYPPEKLKAVAAFSASGEPLELPRTDGEHQVFVTPLPETAAMTLHFDNGIWSRAEGRPSVNVPMNENPGATRGVWAVKYHKAILNWGEIATIPLGQPYELVAVDGTLPRAEEPLTLQVLIEGQPTAGIRVGLSEDDKGVLSDEQGLVTLTPVEGPNLFWSGQRTPIEDHPAYTQISIEYVFSFEALP